VYLTDDKQLVAAPFNPQNGVVETGSPKSLFRVASLIDIDQFLWPTSNAYVAASNGRRFLMALSARDPDAPPISVIVNWPALMAR
jgi:hypothetical protein